MWASALRVWGLRERFRAPLGGWQTALLPGGARGVHSSPVPCGKNLLKKFASKTKKKFWYEGPSLGSHLMYKPSQLEFLTKTTSKKTRKDDQVRLRALNGLLYKALTDLLCTPEVSQEICDLNVQLSKVSLTSDFSACRVYWRTTVSAEQNAHAEAVLRRSAAHMRHILMSQQTLRNVPPIVFLQDKGNAALAEMGPVCDGRRLREAPPYFDPLDAEWSCQDGPKKWSVGVHPGARSAVRRREGPARGRCGPHTSLAAVVF
ncbi:putative ribosome-binding factor A, mitochondrial isoform X3 [Leopardus geoffroyi]|uniref:putative ribosome-binding factor A, mitochondrial isoform X3 n=1 Tax=Leopardus geoffroyi TaxID=46844 RepID=UPI001E263696|nr:putative ribosome-binding factor A, mitochondrial isoform X3 [Leopardus geoffroyi]